MLQSEVPIIVDYPNRNFPVLVIEYIDGPKKHEAYFHRMNKVRMN